MSASSGVDRVAAEVIVRQALAQVGGEWGREDLAAAEPDHDLFAEIDSFAIVELLLQTEADVEHARGRYVPLADEKVLDAENSPLRRLSTWIDYVAKAIAHG
jgi:hypothetical protein